MNKIFLHGMKAETLIGVYEWERKQKQTLLLDIDIGIPEKPATSDDIADTVHYAEVCNAIRHSLSHQNFMLLEALAKHIANLILQDFQALWVRIRIVKPGILAGVREAGVEIQRGI